MSKESPARWRPRPGEDPGWLLGELEDTFPKAQRIGFRKPGLTGPEHCSGGLWVLPGKMSPDNGSLAPWNCMGTPGSWLNHRESMGCRVGAACHVMINLYKALMLSRQWEPEPPRPRPLPFSCCVTQGKPLALSDKSPKRESQSRASVPRGRRPGLLPFPKEEECLACSAWSPVESGDPGTAFP